MQFDLVWNDTFPPLNLWNCPDIYKYEKFVQGRMYKTVERKEDKGMYFVYSKKGCPACDNAIKLLNETGEKVTVVKIDENQSAKEFILQQGFRSVPQIYKDGKHIGDFNNLKKFFDENINLK